jgi:orotidine-5'-phosphate decarboxylase
MTGIFCAIDAASLDEAQDIVKKISGLPLGIKAGLELFVSEGPASIDRLREWVGPDTPIFLDLKLHDIPNTVAGAVRAAVRCRADFLTIHASGGTDMMRRALDASLDEAEKTRLSAPKLLGVTVLTHMDESDLDAVGQLKPSAEQVTRLAKLAEVAGLAGVVCSPLEIAPLRKALSAKTLLVVPGIRPAGSAASDQKRVMTPAEAAKLGADYLVIGRPITQAADPALAAEEILQSLALKAA